MSVVLVKARVRAGVVGWSVMVVAVSKIEVSSSLFLAIVVMAVVVIFRERGEGVMLLETVLTTEGLFSACISVLASLGHLAEELLSCVDQAPMGSCSSVGHDSVATLSRAFRDSTGHT